MAGVLDVAARVHQLDLASVVADDRGLALLADADLDHLRVRVVGVDAGPRAAGAVRDDDSRVVLVLAAEALGDAVEGHELLVVLVRSDADVGRPPQRFRHRGRVRHEDVGVGAGELHHVLFSGTAHLPRVSFRGALFRRAPRPPPGGAGRLAAAIAWPCLFSFSSGVRRRIRSASAGNSSFSTREAVSTMRSPPSPEVTRPSTSTFSIA